MNIAIGTVSRFERQVLVKRGGDRVVGSDEQQRVAVRRGGDRGRNRNIAARAGAVLDDELLAQAIGQPLAHDARGGIDRAARGEAVQEMHWVVWKVASRRRRAQPAETNDTDQAEQGCAQQSRH
jgi:hypothetical protein